MFFLKVLDINPIYETIDKVTRSLTGLTESIDNFTRSIVRLEIELAKFGVPFTATSIPNLATATRTQTTAAEVEEKEATIQKAAPIEPMLTSSGLAVAGDFFKNTGELIDKLEPVSKQAIQLKNVFGIAGNISADIDGLSELFTKEHMTLTDGLEIAGKIALGLMGVLEATTISPQAGVISAAVMVGGSIISYVADRKQKEEAYTAARQQQYEKAIGTFVMDEHAE